MPADSKKVASMVNVAAKAIMDARASMAQVRAIQVKFQAQSPGIKGKPLEGNVTAFRTMLDGFDALLNDTKADAIVAAYSPTHQGRALDG